MSISRTRIRAAGQNIAAHLAVVVAGVVVVEAVAAARADVSRAVPATMPIYLPVAQMPRRLRVDQPSQEAMRSATNIVATMASVRSTQTAAANSAVAGHATGKPENRVVIRVANRAAVVRAAAHVAVALAAVMVDSLAARAQVAAAAAAADRAAAVSRAWVDA